MNDRPTLPLVPDMIDVRLRARGPARTIATIEVGHILPLRNLL